MAINRAYSYDGHVPVLHVGRYLNRYLEELQEDATLSRKEHFALGGIVPNLLRAPKALPYRRVIDGLVRVREVFQGRKLHLFGVGGTATVHLAALLEMDSVDSSGWRNRAARGIVQLPGRGDRMVADLGSWRGRKPDNEEMKMLMTCPCPACRQHGLDGLRANKLAGFCNRATHNLWVLLDEARQIDEHLQADTYAAWYASHVENSVYKPLIDYLVEKSMKPNTPE